MDKFFFHTQNQFPKKKFIGQKYNIPGVYRLYNIKSQNNTCNKKCIVAKNSHFKIQGSLAFVYETCFVSKSKNFEKNIRLCNLGEFFAFKKLTSVAVVFLVIRNNSSCLRSLNRKASKTNICNIQLSHPLFCL